MVTAFLVSVAIISNMIVGAGVWAAIDDEDNSLFNWYKNCPPGISWLVQPLVLSLWPIGVWYFLGKPR